MRQQLAIANAALPKQGNSRANQILVLVSSLCLIIVFYLNGTFSTSYFSSPQPDNNPAMAGDGSLYKTTKTTSVSDVATKALAFKAMLTTAQQATLQQTYTTTLARKWSNLPCGASCRNGIQFGVFTSAQLTAALEVVKAALGSTTNDGYEEFIQNRLAESILNTSGGGSGYDTTLRWICFLNTPSATGSWMLQFGGHHYATNIAFNNGHVVGATPFFEGIEPKSFTWGSATYAPLTDERDALAAMLASLTSSQLTTAHLSSSFSDCTMVPGESNGGTGTFPTTKVGIACSTLTTTQKNLVLAAIQHYTEDMDTATARAVLARYTREIDGTYIAYTGSGTSGDATSFLNTNSNYVRIDGPTVWVELACQNGVVFPTQIHYHTVWRDHSHDYGVDLSGNPIDTTGSSNTTAVTEVKVYNSINIYPNPAKDHITWSMDYEADNATITILSATTGQVIRTSTHNSGSTLQINVSDLPGGLYILKVQDGKGLHTGKFNKM